MTEDTEHALAVVFTVMMAWSCAVSDTISIMAGPTRDAFGNPGCF